MKKKVIISDLEQAPAPFVGAGVELSGDIVSRPLISAAESKGLALWRHDLAPGARISVKGSPEEQVFYALRGDAMVGDKTLPERGAACLAFDAVADIEAGASGAVLMHYVGDVAARPDKPGGCVHVTGERGASMIEDEKGNHIFFADSDCPNCSIWLHSQLIGPGRANALHRHAEDEIIVVVEGLMKFGTVEMPPGQAVSIPEDAYYSFTGGPEGLVFLNFRQVKPYLQMTGMPKTDWLGVHDLMLAQHRGLNFEQMLNGGIPVRVV